MTTAKGELTKERILDAAVDLLVIGGVENLTLDDVLAMTRTSKSQLFHYFPGGKKELRTEATKRQVGRLLRADERPQLDTWEAWDGWIDGVILLHEAQLVDDACEVAALAGRALDVDFADRAIVGRAIEDWFALLRSGLEALRQRELIRADAPLDQLASLILATVEGASVLDKATRSRRYLEPALHAAMNHLRSFSNDVRVTDASGTDAPA